MKLYHINLTREEREELVRFTTTGRHSARKVMHSKILIKAQKGLKDEEIAKHLDVSVRTVERVRKRCTLEGITAALNPKKRPPRDPKLDGDGEARLVQIACSSPPEGRQKWTLHLLADKLVPRQPLFDGFGFCISPLKKGSKGSLKRPSDLVRVTIGRVKIPPAPFTKGEFFYPSK